MLRKLGWIPGLFPLFGVALWLDCQKPVRRIGEGELTVHAVYSAFQIFGILVTLIEVFK